MRCVCFLFSIPAVGWSHTPSSTPPPSGNAAMSTSQTASPPCTTWPCPWRAARWKGRSQTSAWNQIPAWPPRTTPTQTWIRSVVIIWGWFINIHSNRDFPFQLGFPIPTEISRSVTVIYPQIFTMSSFIALANILNTKNICIPLGIYI